MSRPLHVEHTDIIPVPQHKLYELLADYWNGHPNLVPKEHFPELTVLRGGRGAGTVLRVRTRAFGREIPYLLEVFEPEPGSVLVERDEKAGVVTTFKLLPAEAGQSTQLTISSDFTNRRGLLGYLEGLATAPVARMMYRKQMEVIKQYVNRN